MHATKRIACALGAAAVLACSPAWADSDKDVGLQHIGEGVAYALPLVAGGISIWKDDWNGVGQLVLATAATVGTVYGLEHVVKEEAPYCKGSPGCSDDAFPSGTAAVAFAPAQYLWNRYGWEYGLPAYGAAAFVGTTRVVAGDHHVWDVAASGAISWAYNWIITDRYRPPENLQSNIEASPRSVVLALNYRW